MNRSLLTLSTLAVALSAPAFAQTAAPTSLSPAPAAPAPVATNTKIALIAFQEAVFATNEGQAKMADIQKKYEPTKATIETLGGEIDSLKKQLDAAGSTLSDDEKASRARTIDTKSKELQLDEDNAQQSYNADLASAFDALAKELYPVAQKYVAENGFTILLNESQAPNELPLILWAQDGQDVTKAVIDAYNASSHVAAPAHPHASTGATHTTPKPATTAAPKP